MRCADTTPEKQVLSVQEGLRWISDLMKTVYWHSNWPHHHNSASVRSCCSDVCGNLSTAVIIAYHVATLRENHFKYLEFLIFFLFCHTVMNARLSDPNTSMGKALNYRILFIFFPEFM